MNLPQPMICRGFNLFETLAVMSIFIILGLIAAGSFQPFIERHQAVIFANRVVTALRFSRAEAMHSGQNVLLCGSSNGQACDGHWSDSMIAVSGPSRKQIRMFSVKPSSLELAWHSSFSKNNYLGFSADGSTLGQQGRFEICEKRNSSRCLGAVIVTHSGRARIEMKQ